MNVQYIDNLSLYDDLSFSSNEKDDEKEITTFNSIVNKDDIEVELDNDFMTISAKIEEEREEKEQEDKNIKYHTCEFRYGKYKRTISFDHPIRAEEANASYKNGILTIKLPKQHIQEAKTRKLERQEISS